MGKIVFILLALMVVSCGCIRANTSSVVATDANNEQQDRTGMSRTFELPKMFDFHRYVEMYGKHYRAPAEWINRARLFLASAYKVFVQAAKYLHRLASSYFAINRMSDWTDKERLATFGFRFFQADYVGATNRPTESIDLDSIESRDLTGQSIHKSGRVELSGRKKRSADSKPALSQKRHLSSNNLMRDPSEIRQEKSAKLVTDIASNNPLYEDPGLATDQGDDDDEFFDALPSQMMREEPSEKLKLNEENSKNERRDDEDSFEDAISTELEQIPDGVYTDYRETGCLSPVKHQLDCGACYIFSTLALYEYHFCMKLGSLVEFSVQYALDCGLGNGLMGCDGGDTHAVGDYVKYFGLELDSYYPYKNANETCPYDVEKEYSSMGYIRLRPEASRVHSVRDQSVASIERTLETEGPLTISLGLSRDFLSYGGGVDKLDSIKVQGYHMMVLIGHGRQDGREYWLIRNSMGSDWGELGHYKLDKESNRKYLIQLDCLEADFGANINHYLEKTSHRGH